MREINENIIEGLYKDDSQAMSRLYDLYYHQLCLYAVRYVTSVPIAEEVVSDVMYKIWQNRHNQYRPETFKEYLYTATRNTALNYLKQNAHRNELNDHWVEELRYNLIEESPLDKMISDEKISKINKIIDSLPEHCRNVFIMSRIEDMTYNEIAEKTGISLNTVKYHIKTALQKLHKEIDNFFVFFGFFLTLFSFSIVILLTDVIIS